MIHTYSLHQITNGNEPGFDPADYSRFKFGDEQAARQFGLALADGFIASRLAHSYHGQQLVVLSSPYSFIPTATFAMKNHFMHRINEWLADGGYPVAQETKVHRDITYKEDYGELDAAARMQLIGNDTFHIDKVFTAGKMLVFLDDIRITGSHERMIMKMVQQYGLDNELHLLYFAALTNEKIHPNFENYLNYYEIKSIFDVEKIIKSGHFFMNTRVVKYLLHYEPNAFSVFIAGQHHRFLQQLHHMAIGNTYHTIDAYMHNLGVLKEFLLAHNHKQLQHGN